MLYSIGVNLPAHRADHLDRVLVVASPINDINLYAWDMNRVKRFIELDIGIRMELCHSCYRGRSMNTTFIVEKHFIKDCIEFLCKEAQVIGPPTIDNGLFMYNVDHKCSYYEVQDNGNSGNDEDPVSEEDGPPPIPPRPPPIPPRPSNSTSGKSESSEVNICINSGNDLSSTKDCRQSWCFSGTSVDVTINRDSNTQLAKRVKPAIPIPEYWDDYTGSDSCTGGTRMESLFLSDGTLSAKNKDPFPAPTETESECLPPRTIPRKNYESSIPAVENPYYNFQPHLFNHRDNQCFDAPYQISSRIIIKDSGEVQFERNVMGNQPKKRHGGFHFKGEIPIPPRGIRADTDLRGNPVTTASERQSGSGKDNPLWQTNFKLQSRAEAHMTGTGSTGSQFTQTVNASVNATLDVEAPPIPPRPQRRSEEYQSTTASSMSNCSHSSNRTTCKSPVPLPRTSIVSSAFRKSTAHFEEDSYTAELLTQTGFTLESLSRPQAEPLTMHSGFSKGKTLAHHGIPFSQMRMNSDSELESYYHKNGEERCGKQKSHSLKRASEVSDTNDMYVIAIPPPLTKSVYTRSDSRNTLSPSYVDETQFILQTYSTPLESKILEDNEEEASSSKSLETATEVDSAIGSVYDDHDPLQMQTCHSRLPSSLEHEDKDCDFEDAASIAYIQSTYQQRCASSASQDIAESTSQPLLTTNSSPPYLEDVPLKPKVPPRRISATTCAEKEHKRQNNDSLSSNSTISSQESESVLSTRSSPTLLVSTCSEVVSQPALSEISEMAQLKPVPRPRRMAKLNTSKSLSALSSSDSNISDSVNEVNERWTLRSDKKSSSLSTRFFLDEMGIGVSEL